MAELRERARSGRAGLGWLPWAALLVVGGMAFWLAFQGSGPPAAGDAQQPVAAAAPEPGAGLQPVTLEGGGSLPGAGLVEVELRFLAAAGAEPVRVSRGGSLEGRVVDHLGNPRPGASLRVVGGPQDGLFARADAQGRYLFTDLLPGTQFFLVEAASCAPAVRIQRVVQRGRTYRDMEVGDSVALGLLVRGHDGKPLPAARVRVDLGQQEVVTAADGVARFAAVPSGPRVPVDVVAAGHVPTRYELNLFPSPGPQAPVELPPLERGGVVQGVVRSWPGGPLPTVTVMPRTDRPGPQDVVWETWHAVPTEPDGRFRLEGIPTTRSVDVRVSHPEGVAEPRLRTVRPGPETAAFVAFVILRGEERITGRVEGPDAKPVAGALVALEAADPMAVLASEYPGLAEGPLNARLPVPPSVQRRWLTGPDGRFDFAWGDHPRGSGHLVLRASKDGFAPAATEIRTVRTSVVLRLHPEQRDGTLELVTASGAPVAEEVRWFLDGQPLDGGGGLLRGVYDVTVRRGERVLFQGSEVLVGPATRIRLAAAR